jgi:hypothetical protein
MKTSLLQIQVPTANLKLFGFFAALRRGRNRLIDRLVNN